MFGQIVMHISALAIVWLSSMLGGGVLARWGYASTVTWTQVARWVTMIMGGMLCAVLIIHFLPEQLSENITAIILPSFLCAAALHALLLAIDRYVKQKKGAGMSASHLLFSILMIYGFFVLEVMAQLSWQNSTFQSLAGISIDYILRGAVLALLLVEILAGKNDVKKESETDSSSHTSSSW